jgi:hypothetical protein
MTLGIIALTPRCLRVSPATARGWWLRWMCTTPRPPRGWRLSCAPRKKPCARG